jgi:hypothetical protein
MAETLLIPPVLSVHPIHLDCDAVLQVGREPVPSDLGGVKEDAEVSTEVFAFFGFKAFLVAVLFCTTRLFLMFFSWISVLF